MISVTFSYLTSLAQETVAKKQHKGSLALIRIEENFYDATGWLVQSFMLANDPLICQYVRRQFFANRPCGMVLAEVDWDDCKEYKVDVTLFYPSSGPNGYTDDLAFLLNHGERLVAVAARQVLGERKDDDIGN